MLHVNLHKYMYFAIAGYANAKCILEKEKHKIYIYYKCKLNKLVKILLLRNVGPVYR